LAQLQQDCLVCHSRHQQLLASITLLLPVAAAAVVTAAELELVDFDAQLEQQAVAVHLKALLH
jgi:hypothetical protein